ncbi:hypothetical protein HAX54_016310 [Datura stramonium]|uniref:Uncharacterized protein n=1 Tax=Datura stramonium TaxID=4076 RepID=A0ABS8UJW6_DATST|nr:hypothetical protein [Datura stramonium]
MTHARILAHGGRKDVICVVRSSDWQLPQPRRKYQIRPCCLSCPTIALKRPLRPRGGSRQFPRFTPFAASSDFPPPNHFVRLTVKGSLPDRSKGLKLIFLLGSGDIVLSLEKVRLTKVAMTHVEIDYVLYCLESLGSLKCVVPKVYEIGTFELNLRFLRTALLLSISD